MPALPAAVLPAEHPAGTPGITVITAAGSRPLVNELLNVIMPALQPAVLPAEQPAGTPGITVTSSRPSVNEPLTVI